MTRIRANCPDCGDVELAPEEMMIEVTHDHEDLVGEGSNYRFVCPDCASTVRKPADDRIVQLLISGGVPLQVSEDQNDDELALRSEHPESPPPGPALTCDDLLDLHLLLRQHDWFDQLAQMSS